MTDTPTIEQRARGYAAALIIAKPLVEHPDIILHGGADDGAFVQAFITAITEAEAIGEARGMERCAQIVRDWNGATREGDTFLISDFIRKEAAERAGGGAHAAG